MSDIRWTFDVTYGEAIRGFQERLFAEFWYLPAAVYDQVLSETMAWVEQQPEGADTFERLNPYLMVELFKAPD